MMNRALLLATLTAGAFLAVGLFGAFGGAAVPAPAASGAHGTSAMVPGGVPSPINGMAIAPPTACQLPTLVLQLQPPMVVLGQTSMLQAYLVNEPLFQHAGLPACVGTVTYGFVGPMIPGGHTHSQYPQMALDSSSVGAGSYPTTVTALIQTANGVVTVSQTTTLVVLP